MAYFARIEDDVVVELLQADSLPEFHPSLTWVDSNSAVYEGWAYDGNSFTDPESIKTVQETKDEKLQDVSALRIAKIDSGFTYNSKVYQIDSEAQKDMTAIMVQFALGNSNPHGGEWRTSDNEAIPMTDSEVQIFIQSAFAHVVLIKQRSWYHKEQINLLNAKQDITDYDIETGWP